MKDNWKDVLRTIAWLVVIGICVAFILAILGVSCQTVEGPAGKDGFTPIIQPSMVNDSTMQLRILRSDSLWDVVQWTNGSRGQKGDTGLPGPQGQPGPIGPPGKDGITMQYDTTFADKLDSLALTLQYKLDSAIQFSLNTSRIVAFIDSSVAEYFILHPVEHDTVKIPDDTVYINLSDSLTAPKGLLIGMVKTIYTDTCTVAWHHDWLRVDGVPCDSILFRVVLIHSDGVTKLVQPDTPFLPKQTGAIKYLCTGIGLGQWTIWVRACRKNNEGTWIWSRWYNSAYDNFYIQRIVTPE